MASTFPLEVDGIGAFTFRRRTMRDQFRIEAEASRVMGGPVEDDELRAGAIAFASLLVLTVDAPDGWSLEDFDPLNADDTEKVFLVHRRLRESETTFRASAKPNRAG